MCIRDRNVPFVTGDKDLDAKFVAEAKAAGFENLKGHRTVGGMRASIYNCLLYTSGASQQFAMIPMNFMKNRKAGYILTGQWAKKAFSEAKIFGEAVELASSADKTFTYIPDCSDPVSYTHLILLICQLPAAPALILSSIV